MMKERILEFLNMENKTSAQFAAEIGVQPSSISHIISGRNNPSLEFILKMLTRYPEISSDWLLFGNGNPYRASGKSQITEAELDLFGDSVKSETISSDTREIDNQLNSEVRKKAIPEIKGEDTRYGGAVRIICFYSDYSFLEYHPRNE